MDRQQVIAILRGHELELRAARVTPDSDIDLLAAFDDTRRLSLLAVAGIERQISQTLGRTTYTTKWLPGEEVAGGSPAEGQ